MGLTSQTAPPGVSDIQLIYGYIPTVWICVLYIALFSVSAVIHIGQAIRFKMWWLVPTVALGAIGEIIGWSGRLWSSQTYLGSKVDPYLMQICSLIISPTPVVAANFVILGIIVNHLGREYSRLSPKWYTIAFCSADIIALIVQALGGAKASIALQTNTGSPETGGHIMLAGIVFQLVSIIVYVALGTEFLYRFMTNKPYRKGVPSTRRSFDHRIKLMILALCFSTLCLIIRSIYRTIELAEGWLGRIIRTEVYFNVLDAAMIVLAVYTMNILHPGILLAHIKKSDVAVEGTPKGSGDGVYLKQTDYASQAWAEREGGSNATVINTKTV